MVADHGVVCSMSRLGNVWNNAAMESFFSSLKTKAQAATPRPQPGQRSKGAMGIQFVRVI